MEANENRVPKIDKFLENNSDMKKILFDLIDRGIKKNDLSDLLSNLEIIIGESVTEALFDLIAYDVEDSIEEINNSDSKNKEYLISLIINFSADLYKMHIYENQSPFSIAKINEYLSISKIDFRFERVDGETFDASFNLTNFLNFMNYFITSYKSLLIYNYENNKNFDIDKQKTKINQYREFVNTIIKEIEDIDEVK